MSTVGFETGPSGTWGWDCRAPALAETYVAAIERAESEGWRLIRGVHRCPACATADDAKERGNHDHRRIP